MTDTRKPAARAVPGSGAFADPGRLAPSIERAWREDFIVELRLLGVPGDAIGDVLVTAESHVREAGESAQEAFGDARSYARETAQSSGAGVTWRPTAAQVVGNGAGLVGMLATFAAFTGWLDDGAVTVTLGALVGLGVILALLAVLLLRPAQILRFLVDHRLAAALLAPVLLTGAFVAILLLLSQPLVDVAAMPMAAFGVALIAVSCALAWFDTDDAQVEITAPGQRPRSEVGARLVSVLVTPAMTVLLLVLGWALSLLG